ncbi:P-loop containing nucleoside triphosphate hydrolase protein [Ceratobasidium sp. AG-I]|nr:P-loop containing nucleoside triphosphate hydrolase protein [Ceratobasidium sp. AG-I]
MTHRAPGQNVTAPAQFPHEEDFELPLEITPTIAPSMEVMTEKDFLELHSFIALEKFIPMSQTLIDSILNDSDASHVFHVSAKEKEIIYHHSACFVLGRSGTGKTTSILFKMIGIEKLYEQMEDVAKPRQVFVTQSRVLAQRVQEYYQNLVTAASSTSQGAEQPQDEEHVLADLDDEDASAFGLPPRYSMLEDKHFPLFLTYDQLCSLLEADFGLKFKRSTRTKAHVAAEQRFAIHDVTDVKIDLDKEIDAEQTLGAETSPVDTKEDIAHARRAAVTFDIFVAAYWQHFDYQLKKGLDPALVYSEFLGVIEGSEFALGAKNGALSREEYANVSDRKTSFASQRDRVYDLYEIYRKRKRELGGYDAAERTHALIGAMNGGIPGAKIDCLYVDEAQDNLLIDIKLLHTLSNNPHGIFMAGDTAQTISAGSSFRFEDLKAFMWRLEEKDEAVQCGKRNAIHPALFHLAVNYRSHGGIVDCASSVVQLISELFPHSIDTLNKETGLIDGPKPIFFSGWDRGEVRFEQFLRGEADTRIDFGASQVILVRNDAARDALRAQVGEIGLILTLYESKGLEFDDVLLYNFFEDSVPSVSVWRVILHGLQGVNVAVPRFDEIRHAVICTELKNLYVGLTRARNHCWIWEESDKGEPMKMFWTKKKLVSLCGPEDPMPQLGVSSSEADWAKSGRLLFNKGLYPQAMFCFEKADLLVERDIASAYQARKNARLLLAKDRQTRRAAFRDAAKNFLDCAILSKGKQQTSCYLRAAECYLQAEEWKSAAESFLSANEFDQSAKNFRRAGCFSEAVGVVKQHRPDMTAGLADEIYGIARLQFLRKSQYQQATELFDDVEEQLEYMEDYGFDAARIHVLELHKRFADAATVALGERNILECVRLLLCSDDGELIRQAVGHIVHGLWTLLPYGTSGAQIKNPVVASLLQQISTIDTKILNEHEQRQIEIFQVLHSKNLERTVALARANAALARSSEAHASEALLCFAHCSGNVSSLRNSTTSDLIVKSSLALSYFNGLGHLARNFQASSLEAQRLLGFEPVHSNSNIDPEESDQPTVPDYWLFSSSIMFEKAQAISGAVEPTPFALGTSAIVVSESDICRLAPEVIMARLTSEARNMHVAANAARYIQPCLEFAIFGKCNRSDCGRGEINSLNLAAENRQAAFNARVRAHILQVLIAHTYSAKTVEEEREHKVIKWNWFRKTYDTLTPHFPPLGGVLCVDPKLVLELNRGAEVISGWCERNLQELDPGYGVPSRFLSDVLASLELAFRVNRQNFAAYAPLLHSRRLIRGRFDLLLSPQGVDPRLGRSIVHDFIDFYMGKSHDNLFRVTFAIHHILFKPLAIEANVLVHLLESVGREMILQARKWAAGNLGSLGIFDGLLLPQSWALDIVKHPPPLVQQPWQMHVFVNSLYKVLEYLRTYDLGNSVLYGFSGGLTIIMRGVLILRICRLLILVALNFGFHMSAKNDVRINIARSLTGPGNIHNALCSRFARADSWNDLEAALNRSPLNRAADQLVHLRRAGNRARTIPGIKQVFYNNIKPELENLLSLTGPPDKQSGGNSLNPEAKSFVQSQPGVPNISQDSGTPQNEGNSAAVETDIASNQTTADNFGGLVPSQVDYLASAPKAVAQRVLTSSDIIAGKCILFFYRRYSFRQRVKAWLAVRTIRSYYLRHRQRHRIVHTAFDERLRVLHQEYKKDASLISGPLLLAQVSRRHQHILLGPMPHVVEYLRGLERINQRQKESNKKRLQKVQHEELEKVQARMNICSDLSKRFKRLGPKIQPGRPAGSVLHNMQSLREKVQEVDSLRSAIIQAFDKTAIPAALEAHYELGVKAILAPSVKPTAPNPPKPELNTSDLGEGLELY